MMIGVGLAIPQVACRGGGRESTPLRVVTTQNRVLSAASTSTGRSTQFGRWPVIIGQDSADLIFSFNNWYISATAETAGPVELTLLEAALENDGATVTVPITFAGQRSLTIPVDAVDLQSDRLRPSSFSLDQFTRGEQYWLKLKIQTTAAGNAILSCERQTGGLTGSQCAWYDPAATTVSGVDTLGQFTTSGTAPASVIGGYVPLVLGHPLVDGPSFFAVGDSIAAGQGDGATSAGRNGNGFVQRASHDADGTSNPVSMINFARQTTPYTAYNPYTRWLNFIQYARYAIEEGSTNDIGTSGAVSLSTIQSRVTTMWGLLRDGGAEKIIRTTLQPRTSSASTNWTSDADQTPITGWALDGTRDQLNDWFEAKLADETIDAIADMRPATESATDPNKWVSTGANDYATPDGIHPSAAIHEAMAVVLRSAMAGI